MINLQETLSDLISIPSVNPMGQSVSGSMYYETEMTNYLEDFFKRHGLPSERQSVEPQRDNIFARIDGSVSPSEGGQVILFDAHQDTVQVDGMTIPPWTPTIRDGRIYGRGSCDIKGGMAAMLGAFVRLAEERPPHMPTIIMACSMNEEFGASGAGMFEKFWNSGSQSIFPRKPDVAIIAEPTSLDVVVAHKGTVRWWCRTPGVAAHSSQPDSGISAIFRMRHVLSALENYANEVCPNLPGHPLCGQPTLSVGIIKGGRGINTVADECSVAIDRRVLPGEDLNAVYQQVINHIKNFPGIDFEVAHEPPFSKMPPLSDESNGALAESLNGCARKIKPNSDIVGTPYGTNAGAIIKSNVPCVVFGPGSIDQAHTKDEWLSLDELHQASEVIYEFGCNGLTVKE